MTIKLNQEQLEALVNADENDPIVWQVNGTHGHRFQQLVLLQSDRDKLVETFGQPWVDRYLEKAEADLKAWEITGVSGVH